MNNIRPDDNKKFFVESGKMLFLLSAGECCLMSFSDLTISLGRKATSHPV